MSSRALLKLIGFKEETVFKTDDGHEFLVRQAAEDHCFIENLITELSEVALIHPDDARTAIEYLVQHYNIEPKE